MREPSASFCKAIAKYATYRSWYYSHDAALKKTIAEMEKEYEWLENDFVLTQKWAACLYMDSEFGNG